MPGCDVAEEEADRCPVCGEEYSPFNPSANPPACSKEYWFFWTTVWDHRGNPCWITGCLEVFCGIRTPGYCCECDVFKTEEEIKKRRIDKDELFGNH